MLLSTMFQVADNQFNVSNYVFAKKVKRYSYNLIHLNLLLFHCSFRMEKKLN